MRRQVEIHLTVESERVVEWLASPHRDELLTANLGSQALTTASLFGAGSMTNVLELRDRRLVNTVILYQSIG